MGRQTHGSERATVAPFAAATALANPPAPQAAVAAQSCEPPAGTKGYAAIRAIDEPGNIGLPPVVRVR